MHRSSSYFQFAENDYKFIKHASESGELFNGICYLSKGICKKYLLHVIELNNFSELTLSGVKPNSFDVVCRFINSNIMEFKFDWTKLKALDFYSNNTEYPSDTSFIVDNKDIDTCISIVSELRDATLEYLNYLHSKGIENTKKEPDSVLELKRMLEFSKDNRGEIY